MRGVGASLDRLEVRWDAVEPAPGVYQFDQLDALMLEARRLDFRVLAVVDGTPAWAAADAAAPGAAVPLGLERPARLADGRPNPANPWAAFLATLAGRYGGQVAAWEIWNEPNSRAFWRGTPAEYARLYAEARGVLGRVAPGAAVLSGGLVSDDGGFLRAVAAALCPAAPCAATPPAAVAWHVYDNPADITRLATLTRAALAPYGVAPQLWITEANVPVDDAQAPGDAVVGRDAVSLPRQAAFVLQADALARAASVQALVIYRASDVDDQGHYWGLLRGDRTARPALLAYRTAAEWLSHSRPLALDHPQSEVTVARFCGAGDAVDVAWNDGPRPVTIDLPVAGPAHLVGMDGSVTDAAAPAGVLALTLPGAAARTPSAVPLGQPRLVVAAAGCH